MWGRARRWSWLFSASTFVEALKVRHYFFGHSPKQHCQPTKQPHSCPLLGVNSTGLISRHQPRNRRIPSPVLPQIGSPGPKLSQPYGLDYHQEVHHLLIKTIYRPSLIIGPFADISFRSQRPKCELRRAIAVCMPPANMAMDGWMDKQICCDIRTYRMMRGALSGTPHPELWC